MIIKCYYRDSTNLDLLTFSKLILSRANTQWKIKSKYALPRLKFNLKTPPMAFSTVLEAYQFFKDRQGLLLKFYLCADGYIRISDEADTWDELDYDEEVSCQYVEGGSVVGTLATFKGKVVEDVKSTVVSNGANTGNPDDACDIDTVLTLALVVEEWRDEV